MLRNGLYEQVINKALEGELATTDKLVETAPIDGGESSKVLSKYIAEIIEKGLDNVRDNGGALSDQVELVNKIVATIMTETKEAEFDSMAVAKRAEQLLALFDKKDNAFALNEKAEIVRPETSIAQSSLFTGAIHEPQMFTELKKEIISADRIDMLVSFIKWSGLRLIIDELTAFTQKGGELRIITTSYMGATDVKAVEELSRLPNTQIKVSYDTKRTRLHAKSYVFYRNTGFTTAYVGSSNLSNAAISSGLEWNVKVTKKDLPETIDKIVATFESYWNSREFEYYNEGQRERLSRALKAEKYFDSNNAETYTFDITPYSYQQEILDKLEAERTVRGQYRNLVVAATGTGKTVISAFDYKRFRKQNPNQPCRLLFIAHREEILKQSIYTFRGVLKDQNFGEMFVGAYVPESIDNLFMSIQTFNSQDFTSKTSPEFYDYIVVDEFHHAAAPTYQKLLSYYKPKILLGLTATPERMDGKSITEYFNNCIAAEIRLPEAIDRKLLCPFQYFGVTDTVDLSDLKWARGGYDKSELSKLYTFSGMIANRRADAVISSLLKYSATRYELVENYRSKANIVALANRFAESISHRMKQHPIEAVRNGNGTVQIIRHTSDNMEEAIVRQIIEQYHGGKACVLTGTNEEALRVLGLLLKNGIRAKLIQSIDGFRLYNLAEARFFLRCIDRDLKTSDIGEDLWNKAKAELARVYADSRCLENLLNMISEFEKVNTYGKYRTDLEEFIKESQFEDFYTDDRETIFVSTIHKSKGREFDSVWLLLNHVALRDDTERRKLYVGMTRAKDNLYIHCNNGVFDTYQISGVEQIVDEEQYPEPQEITLQLTHKDVFLDFFKGKKDIIFRLRSGMPLSVKDGLLYAELGGRTVKVAKLSKARMTELEKLSAKGYRPRGGEVRFVVAWKGEGDKEETAVLLPNLYFKKD